MSSSDMLEGSSVRKDQESSSFNRPVDHRDIPCVGTNFEYLSPVRGVWHRLQILVSFALNKNENTCFNSTRMNFISPCQSWQHEVEWDGFPQPLGPHPQRARSEAPTWVFHETEAKKLFLPDNPLWCALPLWKAKWSLIDPFLLCKWRINYEKCC